MSIYTVHEPPLRAAESIPDPERFVFVRDGFSLWAFLVAALWMLWHRMWLVLLIYVVIIAGLQAAMRYGGVPGGVIGVTELLISLLIGLEASTLRRFTLWRRGWRNVGVVSGQDEEDAERRFFAAWKADASQPGPGRSSRRASSPAPRTSPSTDVIGLFPQPGASV